MIERFGKLTTGGGKLFSWRLFGLFWPTVELGMITKAKTLGDLPPVFGKAA